MLRKTIRRRFLLAIVTGCHISLLCLRSSVLAQEAKTKIRISYPTASICCIPLFAAQQWRIFEENGLEVESIQMRSQAANAALVSGDIHYVAGVGPSSVVARSTAKPPRKPLASTAKLSAAMACRPVKVSSR